MSRFTRLASAPLALLVLLVCAAAVTPAAGAQGLEDEGGAAWRLEQPPPPPPPPGVVGSGTLVGLGKVGDLEFWAPNRGLLITAGNGATIAPGLWAYNGREWHQLSTVCGATDGRIVWAGPDEFWTISDGRPGQAADAFGNPPPLEDNTLCHFVGGRVVASYASLAFRGNSYQAMHTGACINASDCWFAGDPLPPPQVGSFHLHWNGSTLTEEPYSQDSYAMRDMRAFAGHLYESATLTAPTPEEPAALRIINPRRVVPQFEAQPGLPLYGGEEFPTALQAFRLSSADGALWAAAGPVSEPPSGSAPGQLTVARFDGESWRQLLGAAGEAGGGAFPGEVIDGIAAEPGTESAWLGLDTQADAEHPSPTATAHVVRVAANGAVSSEDDRQLPETQEVGPKGASDRIACPATHDCWMLTTQGWLFHLSSAGEQLALDGDPSFAGPITERPADEGVPQIQPDAPPPDTSGLLGEAPASLGALPENPKTPPASVTVALLSHIHSKLVHGDTLELRFHLAARARVRLIAKRRRRVVASTSRHVFAAGNRRLLLRLNPRAWPDKLQLQSHPLAPLPTVSANAGASETVSTALVVLTGGSLSSRSGLLP